MELPPANTAPLDRSEMSRRLRGAEWRLARRLASGRGVLAAAPTRTKVDVGRWLGKRRVCACLLADELILLAPGPRPYAESVAMADLQSSSYNHVTGEVVLAPAPDARVRGLKLTPLEGLRVLAQIYKVDQDHA